MALTFGHYAFPALARPLAMAAVVALTAVNVPRRRQDRRRDEADRRAGAGRAGDLRLRGDRGRRRRVWTTCGRSSRSAPRGVLQAAGLLFFAFAGYARIATLGEEVIDPARTIPRAIPLALALDAASSTRR